MTDTPARRTPEEVAAAVARVDSMLRHADLLPSERDALTVLRDHATPPPEQERAVSDLVFDWGNALPAGRFENVTPTIALVRVATAEALDLADRAFTAGRNAR